MREIKFRAWDKESKEMVTIRQLDWFTNSGCTKKQPSHVYIEGDYLSDFSSQYDYDDIADRFELMQFTGRLDKNGKEIYEGDRVRFASNSNDPSDEVSGVIEIEWDNNECGFVGFDQSTDERLAIGEYIYDEGEIEVIGNIYENGD